MSQSANPPLRDHEAARRRYEALVAAVARAIDEADPKGLLELGAPADEYSAEVGTVVPRVSKAQSQSEVRSILQEELERWFGMGEVGPVEKFDEPATVIWNAVLTFRQTV
jgi:hypothetical protein